MSNKSWEESVAWLKEQPDQRDLVQDCYFDDPLIEAAKRYYRSSEWREVRRFLPDTTGKALDVGSGRGISAYALARDGWDVTALEPDNSVAVGAGAIRMLSEEAKLPIQIEQGWGESIPFNDATFDIVHARQVLHHATDLQKLCNEIGRVLKKGGVLVATREHVISRQEDLDTFLRNHPLHRFYGGENAYKLNDYLTAITGAGISLTHVLNPYQSDINLFPDTRLLLKKRLAQKIMLPFPQIIPDTFISWLGSRNKTPGRLYSFIGRKIDD